MEQDESFTDTSAFTSVSQHFYNDTESQFDESILPNYEEFKDSDETERLINVFASPVIILFGTIANFMTLFVMRRGSLKEVSTCFYMAILVLTDTGKCNQSIHNLGKSHVIPSVYCYWKIFQIELNQ